MLSSSALSACDSCDTCSSPLLSTAAVARGAMAARLEGNRRLLPAPKPKPAGANCLLRRSLLSWVAACCLCCLTEVKAWSHFHTDCRKDTAMPLLVTVTSCSASTSNRSTYTG